jgi:hypothetical protein
MTNQEQPEDLEDFKFLGSLIRNNGNRVKLNSGLPWQNQNEEYSFASKLDLCMERKHSCATFGTYLKLVLKIRHSGMNIIYNFKFLSVVLKKDEEDN